ncbi:MAG TPA: hypothetical protein VNZ26_11485 [Vicinamibacterales bacterium]|jgi:hypothetical protein|nr:hypothetical protein [Vicinamibacterales bacterium]
MKSEPVASDFRVEKSRTNAIVTLSTGESAHGYFFIAKASARLTGPERVGELLNGQDGFFPFEISEGSYNRTVLYNRLHVVVVMLADSEAQRDPGYEVAARRTISVLLSNGRRLIGNVRIYQPDGHDRLSDWAREGQGFRYVETEEGTFLVNLMHVIEVSEIAG